MSESLHNIATAGYKTQFRSVTTESVSYVMAMPRCLYFQNKFVVNLSIVHYRNTVCRDTGFLESRNITAVVLKVVIQC